MVLASACRFEPGTLGDAGSIGSDGKDAAPGDVPDAPTDASPPLPLCDSNDATLRACFTFDGNGQDGSSSSNDVTLAGGMTFGAGRPNAGQALVTTMGTASHGNTTTLDVSAMTMDVWIRPTTVPTGGARAGVFDASGRFRIFLQSDGAIRCSLSPGSTTEVLTATGLVAAGVWRRITCTYGSGTLRLYLDGAMVGQSTTGASIVTSGAGFVVGHNSPTGDNFNGAIDDLRVFSTVVPP
jgi:hypothetical protein